MICEKPDPKTLSLNMMYIYYGKNYVKNHMENYKTGGY